MRKIKVKIEDTYIGFDSEVALETRLLGAQYDVEFVENNPDILLSASYTDSHLKHDCIKIFMTDENDVVNPKYTDIAINSLMPNTNRLKQYSSMIQYPYFNEFLTGQNKKTLSKYQKCEKTEFCAFMYSNRKANSRIVFCKMLMKYKRVACLGKLLHNKNSSVYITEKTAWHEEVLQVYQHHKFVIAFENSSCDGYVTEKIFLPLCAGSIPIYWGADDVKDYINPDCFINVNDFDSFEECIEYVKKVDEDPKLYKKYRSAQPVLPSSKLHQMTEEKIGKWLKKSLDTFLDNPDTRLGSISFFEKIKYKIWFWWSMKLRREKQRWLYNVKMPIWEKIKWAIKNI